ncbi:caspase family protein, partial [Escherichia coli]|uniref:caspase family protein n=1 Tax=Escherichia coli TaxID=562 RepID=UPI0039E0DB0C
GRDAVAVVYFAGHGFQDEGINYLVPIGAELPSRAYLKARTLAVDDIVQALATTARKANVIVLDACRKSPLVVQPRTRDVTE